MGMLLPALGELFDAAAAQLHTPAEQRRRWCACGGSQPTLRRCRDPGDKRAVAEAGAGQRSLTR